MPEETGVNQPAEAQQDKDTGQTKVDGAAAFGHPEVKDRLSQLSAQKNQFKEQAEAERRAREELEMRLAQIEQKIQGTSAPEPDEEDQWTEEKILKPLEERIDGKLEPLLEKMEREAFWSGRNDGPEIVEEVENTVAQLKRQARLKGQRIDIDRNMVRQLVLGQRYERQLMENQNAEDVSRQQTQAVNKVAQVADGPSPPEPEPENFEELDPDEQFERLVKDGAFSRMLR